MCVAASFSSTRMFDRQPRRVRLCSVACVARCVPVCGSWPHACSPRAAQPLHAVQPAGVRAALPLRGVLLPAGLLRGHQGRQRPAADGGVRRCPRRWRGWEAPRVRAGACFGRACAQAVCPCSIRSIVEQIENLDQLAAQWKCPQEKMTPLLWKAVQLLEKSGNAAKASSMVRKLLGSAQGAAKATLEGMQDIAVHACIQSIRSLEARPPSAIRPPPVTARGASLWGAPACTAFRHVACSSKRHVACSSHGLLRGDCAGGPAQGGDTGIVSIRRSPSARVHRCRCSHSTSCWISMPSRPSRTRSSASRFA